MIRFKNDSDFRHMHISPLQLSNVKMNTFLGVERVLYAKLMLYPQFCTTAFSAWVQKRKSHSSEKCCVNHSNSSHIYQEYQVEGCRAAKNISRQTR